VPPLLQRRVRCSGVFFQDLGQCKLRRRVALLGRHGIPGERADRVTRCAKSLQLQCCQRTLRVGMALRRRLAVPVGGLPVLR